MQTNYTPPNPCSTTTCTLRAYCLRAQTEHTAGPPENYTPIPARPIDDCEGYLPALRSRA